MIHKRLSNVVANHFQILFIYACNVKIRRIFHLSMSAFIRLQLYVTNRISYFFYEWREDEKYRCIIEDTSFTKILFDFSSVKDVCIGIFILSKTLTDVSREKEIYQKNWWKILSFKLFGLLRCFNVSGRAVQGSFNSTKSKTAQTVEQL